MVIRILSLCAALATGGALIGCSGEQPPAATAPTADRAADAPATPTDVAPALPQSPAPVQLSTPLMDRMVTAATNELVGAQDRCNKLTGALRDGCHKQAQAFYEASIDKARKPVH